MDEYAAEEALIKLDRIAERRIREAIDAGEFDNLKGMGQPLADLEDNPHVPEDLRIAFKVLQNSGYAPDWVHLANDIEGDIDRLRLSADRHFQRLRDDLYDISGDPYAVKRMRAEVKRLKQLHRHAATRHRTAMEEINRKITLFNQTVPIASLFRVPLPIEDEMARFEDRLPAYLQYVGD